MSLITAKQAAKAALDAGLSLSDAAALGRMAETEAEAAELAQMFASPKPVQIGREALKSMSSEQIVAAKTAGQLDTILKGGDQ
jgi:hypothetical protein